MLCLVVEYLAEGSEFPPFTRTHPGSTVDLIAELAASEDLDRRTALVMVRGAPWQALDALVADLGQRNAPVTTMRRDPARSLWFGRVTFHPSRFRSPSARAIAGLLGVIGPPWIHVEHGVVHLRARLKDPALAEDVLHLTAERLRAAGVDAQVVVQEVSPKDHSVWETLVQAGLGITL